MSSAYCAETRRFFCSGCAIDRREVSKPFWVWKYHFAYQSPWSGRWESSLDRLEFDGRHPLQQEATEAQARKDVSTEEYLDRYPEQPLAWFPEHSAEYTEDDVRLRWNANADIWIAGYDEDGDANRRFLSDEPMLALLGEVTGRNIVDVGSGNGYLCRKLAKAGASMTGVELSDRFLEIAKTYEAQESHGISYYHGSVSKMGFLPTAQFDKAVSNYVLMDVLDYETAIQEVFRLLRPGGLFVAVISHPCFGSGPAGWVKPALDSPRREDRTGFWTDSYFYRGPMVCQWGDLSPFISFHRPLGDYWKAFTKAGFVVDAFEEPCITERGRREIAVSRLDYTQRIPYSCIFRLVKP